LKSKKTLGNYSCHPVHPANPVILSRFSRRARHVAVVQFFGAGNANAIGFDFVDLLSRLSSTRGHEKYEKHEDEIP
jgi:hypothetical protein